MSTHGGGLSNCGEIMNKFSGKSIRLIIVALLAGLLTPVTAAVSVDNITKTFTVRGANDAPIANAIVQTLYLANEQATTYTRPTPTTTDANGVAAVTLPKDVLSLSYNIAPATGDTTNAVASGTLSSTSSESIAVKLESANFVVDVQGADGGAAPIGAVLYYPTGDGGTNTAYNPVRTGAIGIRLGTNLNTSNTYAIRLLQYVNEYAAGQFSYTYGLKASGTSGNQSYTVYTDMTASTVVPPVNGVNVLKYDAANLQGTLKNADGSAFSWPGTTGFANLRVAPVAQSWPVEAASQYPITGSSSQFQWFARSRGTPGKYVLGASFPGSLTVPSFFIDIWKNSSNAFALNENGPYTTNPHTLDIRFPARGVNFAWKYVASGTTNMEGFSYSILRTEVINGQSVGVQLLNGNGGTTGFGSLSLQDGTYVFVVSSYSGTTTNYKIVVSGGVSTLQTIAGTTISKPSDNVYVLSPTPANLKIKAVSAANPATVIQNAYVEVFNGADGKGGFVVGRGTGTTTADATLPDGTYMIRVNPGNDWANYASTEKVVTVSGGVATITDLLKVGDVYSIALPVKNFKYKMLEAGDSTSPMSGWINYCPLDSNGNQITCYGEGTNQNGEGGAALANSTSYKINVYPPSSSSSSQSSYTATVDSSGGVSLSPATTLNNSRFVLRPQSANVSGTLVTEANGQITFGNNQGISVQVQKKVNGNWNWYPLGIWRNTGTWGFNITENGEYRILANPQGFADYAWSYSDVFYVSGADGSPKVFSMASNNSNPTSSITGLVIQVKESNLKLRIIDPRSNELMKYGWAAIFKKETGRETWVMNADLNSNMPGLTGAKLDNGDYRIEVNPQYNGSNIAGLTKKNYDLTVDGSTLTVSYKGTAIAPSNNRVTIAPSTSNITAKIVDAAGLALKPGNNQWVSVNLQKLNTSTNNWDWTNNWANTDKDGFIAMTVTDAGKYRLRVEPNGYASSTITTTEPFTVDAGSEGTFNKAFGDIALSAPSLRVRVAVNGSTTPINFIGVEIRKNNNWLDWSGTGPTGIANIAFTAEGTYQLVVHPRQEELGVGATRKSYEVSVTKNSAGAFVGSVTGLTATDGIFTLNLGVGNVRGTVVTPESTPTPVRDSQVVAINTVTKQEMWEYSTNTNIEGKFTMNLPVGTYTIMARSPWGTNSYGSSDAVGTVTVTSTGVSTADNFQGIAATALELQLKSPTWKGTVMVPGTDNTVVPYAQVCLWDEIRWNCSTANAQGQWALSAPTGFNAALDNPFATGAAFEIADVRNRLYPNIRKNGAAAVLALIGKGGSSVPADATSTTSTTLVNRFSAPNVTVTVTAGGVAQPNVWVNLDSPGVGWLGGNSTNAQGVASFSVPNNTVAMNARAEFNGNQNLTGRYAPTLIEFTSAQVIDSKAGGATANLTVALLTPNFNGVVTQTATNLAPVQWSWIELFDDATNQWKGGSNTDAGGEFAMNITRPTSGDPYQYTMVVNPPWNATGSVSKRTYTVTVPVSGDITVKDKNTSTSIAKAGVNPNTYFPMTLGTPSVSGTVVSGSGNTETTVRDSRVTPISSTGEWLWQQGQHTKADGAFGLGLADGNYNIQADVPWGVTGLTRSAQCAVTVTGGAITSAGANCNPSGGAIKLALREPNLKMTLVLNGSPVPYAHVGIGVGNWNTGSQADAQGRVSLFVDRAAILAANPNMDKVNTSDIRVWVDPPYGNSNMVRWDCNSGDAKPVCATMPDFNPTQDYAVTDLTNVTVLGPNTKFKINLPNASAAPAGSWINLFSFVSNPNASSWVTGGNTDASGNVSFNVETTTATANLRYKVEVNPRWEDRAIYSQKVYDNGGSGFTLEQLNEVNRTFALGSPNVILSVKGSDVGATANRWGHVNIVEVDPSTNNMTNWVGGYGLDTLGKVALTLAPNKRYRIAAFPGGGIAGTRSWCFVDTSNASESNTVLSVVAGMCGSTTSVGANNAITINLNAGNVVGTVKTSGVAVEGAIVYANLVNATNQDNAVTTTTNSLGKFGLLLDPAKGQWQISIFPINKPGATALRNKILEALTPPDLASSRDLGDIALVP
jgi:hypothetical protein